MKIKKATMSRRGLLTAGAAAVAGGAALGTPSMFGQAPAVITVRRFRGWVTRGGGTNRTTLQELTLRPVTGRQLVVRTEATNLCYSNVGAVTGLQPAPAPAAAPAAGARGQAQAPPPQAGAGQRGGGGGVGAGGRAVIQGHGGV